MKKSVKFKKNTLFDVFVALIDALLIFASYYLSLYFLSRIGSAESSYQNQTSLYIFLGIMLLLMYGFELYLNVNRKKHDILLTIFIVTAISAVITFLINYISYISNGFGRFVVLLTSVFSFLLLFIWRAVLASIYRKVAGKSNLLVIEDASVDDKLARKIKYSCPDLFNSWYTRIDTKDEAAIEEFLKGEFTQYESIFITQSIPEKLRMRIISEAVACDKEIYMLPSLYEINLARCEMVQFDDTPALKIRNFKVSKGQQLTKRIFDIFVSCLALIVTSPIMLIIALAIKLTSPGPVIYAQERLTKNRKVFKIYKFRSMVKDAEKITGPVLASYEDPRVTKVGKFLRATRLDELPQFFNVLKGDMSIVGPRPERPVFVEQYLQTVENYDLRFSVKAGLTCYSHIYGRYSTDVKDRLLFDLIYIRECSFLQDIKIILMTIKVMFMKENSVGIQNEKFLKSLKINTK